MFDEVGGATTAHPAGEGRTPTAQAAPEAMIATLALVP